MPALYIANTSKQDNAFTYKVPEQARGHHKVDIPAGGQVKLNNLSGEAVKSIIEQHAPYGMREVTKVHKEKGFVGLAYSEKEIQLDGIADAFEHNTVILDETGKKLRDAAAVAVDRALLDNAPQGSELRATNVDVIEHETKENQNPQLHEKRTVKPAEDDKAPRMGRRVPR